MFRISVAVAAFCLWTLVSSPVLAERPSVNKLQAEVNQLQAEVSQLQAEVDALQPGALRVLDGAGNVLGIPFSGDFGGSAFVIEEVGLSMYTDSARGLLWTNQLFFEFSGCEGQAFVPSQYDPSHNRPVHANWLIGPLSLNLPSFLATGTQIQRGRMAIASRYLAGVCSYSSGELQEWILAEPFTGTLPFEIPVPDPIYIGLPPAP